MAIASTRDLDQARRSVAAWLGGRLADATDISIGPVKTPDGAGFSNETLLFTAAWQAEGARHEARYVLRVEPSTHTLYYEAKERFGLQVRVLQALAGQHAVPTARVAYYEPDARWLGSPFFVLEYIDGRTQPDLPAYNHAGWLKDATAEQQQALWWRTLDALADIHLLDWKKLGLHFLLQDDRGNPGIDQQLCYQREFYDWGRGSDRYPAVEAMHGWLVRHKPTEEPLALCWGDARVGNVIYRDFSPAAIIDWDMVTIGNPLQDLAWWFFLDEVMFGDVHSGSPGDPLGLPGFPSKDDTLRQWERKTGFDARNMRYYEIFAAYRFCICSIRYPLLMDAAGMPPEAGAYAANLRMRAEDAVEATVSLGV